MHVFEVRITKHREQEQCGFTWPDWWGEVYQKVDVVAYEDHPDRLGTQTEGAVCVCDDETWEKIAVKEDPLVMQLTEAAANEKGQAWRPQITRVTDEQKVLLITAKVALGQILSSEEKKALDPDDPAPGVGKSPLFDVRKICEDKGGDLSED